MRAEVKTVKVFSRGQITLPREVREALGTDLVRIVSTGTRCESNPSTMLLEASRATPRSGCHSALPANGLGTPLSEQSTSVVDANAIITLLLGGNRVHFERARAFFESVREGTTSAYIPAAVLAECVYVLTRVYGGGAVCRASASTSPSAP